MKAVSFHWFFAAWLMLASVSMGQEATGEEEAPLETARAIQFAAFGNDFFEGLKFRLPDDKVRELRLYPDRRSHVYQIPHRVRRLVFFREVPSEEEGIVVEEPQAEAYLDGLGEAGLLVFFVNQSEEAGALPYEVLSIDEDPESFGPGALRFLNLTGRDLIGQFGVGRLEIPAGISDTFVFSDENWDPRPFRLWVRESEGEGQLVYSSGASLDARKGVLLAIKPPRSSDGRIVSVRRL